MKDKVLYYLLNVLFIFSLIILFSLGRWSLLLITTSPESISFAVHPVPWYQDISVYAFIIMTAYIVVSFCLIRRYRAIITNITKEKSEENHEKN